MYRGFSPPAPGSPGASPELSVNYETGVRYAAPRVRAELIGYYNDYSNLTDVCTLSSGCPPLRTSGRLRVKRATTK